MLRFASCKVSFVYFGLSVRVWCKFWNCVVCAGLNHCLGQVSELLVTVVHYDAILYIAGHLRKV